ncbi:MAG: radical SAM protein [Desulfurococcaceae archaeon]
MARRYRYVFGPVRSRRLGRSLGVNHVPYKTCTYSCIYCQLGRTTNLIVERKRFHDPREVVEEVCSFLSESGEPVDYVTLVPDGEPLLDRDVGLIIAGAKECSGKPVAVLTNASLLFLEDARQDLLGADFVSVKVDAVREATWRRVNRPHPRLELGKVLEGIAEFAKEFRGMLTTETMLVSGFNTAAEEVEAVASFIKELNPARAYVAVPIRPPAEPYAKQPTPEELVTAYSIFSRKLGEGRVELLNMPEPPEFKARGDPESWLLSVVSVHPLRLDYALKALEGAVEKPAEFLGKLVSKGEVRLVEYGGSTFVVRTYGASSA